ncbi:MAG: branched-chain amino acid ABC transporter permease [Chloroflexi bacterium]|nr:branched-chain amino acid ABC transporter permease [Chloroflexota bacterium]
MKRWLVVLGIVLLLAFLPQTLGTYYVRLLTQMLIFAVFAMSLDLLFGYLRLPSLGHAAFFGIAAYVVALFSTKVTPSFWLNLPIALVAATIIAALFGLLALRTKGAYFFMITLALTQILWGIAFNWYSVTGGDNGYPGIPRPDLGFIPWSLESTTSFFYFTLLLALVAAVLMYRVVHSPFGHVLAGIRENELRMRALGYNIWLYKYSCFIIAGLFAGLAGLLSAYDTGFVSPSDFSMSTSSKPLLMVLLGGAGTLVGPAIGAGALIFLENTISAYTERWLLIIGLLFVVVVMFTPQGILGLSKKIRFRKRVGE